MEIYIYIYIYIHRICLYSEIAPTYRYNYTSPQPGIDAEHNVYPRTAQGKPSTNNKLFISIAQSQSYNNSLSRSLYIQQLILTSEITKHTHMYSHGVSPQSAPSRHSAILSSHRASQSLPYLNNTEHQARK